MTIGLLNWSGHQNIGDDAMTFALEMALKKRGHTVINQGECAIPEQVDAYIWGGGTLISAVGVWPILPKDKPVIGFGIGVCEKPPSDLPALKEELSSVKMIFARDIYSYLELAKNNIPCTLSFDPVFLIDYYKTVPREYVGVNILQSPKTDYKIVQGFLDRYSKQELKGFAIGHPEDEAGLEAFDIDYEFYSDPYKLLDFLAGAKATITTRLHAAVFSYLARVPEINPVIYDPKITRFMEYVVANKIPVPHMRNVLNQHLDFALSLL